MRKFARAVSLAITVVSGPVLAEEFEIDGVQLPGIPAKRSASESDKALPVSTASSSTQKEAAEEKGGAQPSTSKRRYTFTPTDDQASPNGIGPSAPPNVLSAPLELEVFPGENQVVTVSKGYANRIVTPFEKPIIRSTEPEGTFYVEGNLVYLAPTDEKTVGAWIQDASGGPALNLAFLPRAIPPREIRVKLKQDSKGYAFLSNSAAIATETGAPYQVAVTDLLTSIAKSYIPTGYTLADPSKNEYLEFFCTLPSANVALMQVLTGNKWKIGVSRVRNNSHFALEIRESDCQQDGILAVAAYPHAVVPPGAEVELYTLRVREKPTGSEKRRRPSVATN